MNTDITFCHGRNCEKRETCLRWIDKMRAYFAKKPTKNLTVSVAGFDSWHASGQEACKYYLSTGTQPGKVTAQIFSGG